MDLPAIVEAANTFGAWSVLVGYLIWDRIRRDAREKEIEEARREHEKEQEAARAALADKRIDADKAQASAMMLMGTAMGMLESTVRGIQR